MREHEFQTPALYFNYHVILPDELYLWTTGQQERWSRENVTNLRAFLTTVLEAVAVYGTIPL